MSYYSAVGTVTKSPAAMASTYAGAHLIAEQAAAKDMASTSSSSSAAPPAAVVTTRPSWLLPALGVLAIGGFVYWRRRQKKAQKGAAP